MSQRDRAAAKRVTPGPPLGACAHRHARVGPEPDVCFRGLTAPEPDDHFGDNAQAERSGLNRTVGLVCDRRHELAREVAALPPRAEVAFVEHAHVRELFEQLQRGRSRHA